MKERVMIEFNLVLENTRLKEDMGIESLHFSKCTFNLLTVDYYRESFDGEGEVEPYTVVILDTGILLTVDIPYNEFKKIYTKKILNEQ
jgi:hypothetical protein